MGNLSINNGGVATNKGGMPNVDLRYGPYESPHAAHEALTYDDVVTIGLTVGIIVEGTIVEYWYQGGTAEANLKPKSPNAQVQIEDGVNTAVRLSGEVHVTAQSGDSAKVEITERQGGGVNMEFTLPKGENGENAVNPFKGVYLDTDTLPTSGHSGDFIYVVDTSTTPRTATVYKWDDNQSEFVDTEKSVEDYEGYADLAERYEALSNITSCLKEGPNILDPDTIKQGYRVKDDGTEATIQSLQSAVGLLYGCTGFIELTDDGLILNHGVGNHASIRGVFGFDENLTFLAYKSATGDGQPLSVTKSGNFANAKYVKFNLPIIDEPDNFYAVYRANELPDEDIVYNPPVRIPKPQQFSTGEYIDKTSVDDTHLENPSANAIAKAKDVRTLLGENIHYKKYTIPTNENIFANSIVSNGNIVTGQNTSLSNVLVVPLSNINKLTFLAGEKSSNASRVGYAIGTFQNGYDGTSLEGFTASSYYVYAKSDVMRQIPYTISVPNDSTDLYAVITLWRAAGVTLDNFYCTAEEGQTVEQLIDSSKTSDKVSTSTGNNSTCIIQCAKEHNYADGTMPIIEWYLLEDTKHDFYYSKDLVRKTFLFHFQQSNDYQFGILPNGDIIAVAYAGSLNSQSQSDGNRVNPYIFKADEKWSTAHEIDFGEYDQSTETGLKPCGWLENDGFRTLPNGDVIFGEYTRTTVETANVWRISGDASDPSNWSVIKTFASHENPVVGDGASGYKHIHCIAYDFYNEVVYCTTGDTDTYAQIWYSQDNGETWTQLEKNDNLNNGQQFRLCMMTFTPDYILWGTDTPGHVGAEGKHVVYRGERGPNGVLDTTTITQLCNVYDSDYGGNFSTYGQAYLSEYNALFLFDRQDGSPEYKALTMPVYVVDIETREKILVSTLKYFGQTDDGKKIGFRCKFKEWYPLNGIIHVGFGFDAETKNINNKCDNSPNTTIIGNYAIHVSKDSGKWSCRFTTLYI